jgi:predicted ABC-type transport system involved in lysophospholipase L1 biosynthesis ATPase subunit
MSGTRSVEEKTRRLALAVVGLQKAFSSPTGGRVEVLRGATLSIEPGAAVAIVGASGAGKTTLLQILGGLERADEGTAHLGEFDILAASNAALIAWRGREVGFVFQSHRLLADLSAEENVALPLRIARRPTVAALDAARRMLARVGLAERARHTAGELSGGEQQRVALARALVARPRLVLADEPTGNLDARTGAEVSALLLELCRTSGACLLVATHNAQLAAACDRTLILREGRLHPPV